MDAAESSKLRGQGSTPCRGTTECQPDRAETISPCSGSFRDGYQPTRGRGHFIGRQTGQAYRRRLLTCLIAGAIVIRLHCLPPVITSDAGHRRASKTRRVRFDSWTGCQLIASRSGIGRGFDPPRYGSSPYGAAISRPNRAGQPSEAVQNCTVHPLRAPPFAAIYQIQGHRFRSRPRLAAWRC